MIAACSKNARYGKQRYALVEENFSQFKSAHIKIKVAKSEWERQGYFNLRQNIFSKEQKIFKSQEKDTKDFQAIPIVAIASSWSIGDEIVGAVRIFRKNDSVNTWYGGRLCVAKLYRGQLSIGKSLINEAVSLAKDHGCEQFFAEVQKQNENYFKSLYWESLEYMDIAQRPHVKMQAHLESYPFMSRTPF